jgi:CubicO group peptidase (beta-lactamase class C family)
MITRLGLCTVLSARLLLAADFNLHAIDPAKAGMDAARLARIPARMQTFVDTGKAAGIVTLVVRHGQAASLNSVGFLDLQTKAPMRTDSIFRIMTMTKPVTSVAVMMLMEEGRLALFDPAEKYLPEFRGQQVRSGAKPAHPVTLFDLLTHTAGVAGPKASDPKSKTLAEEVAAIARQPLDFEPGAQWRYRTEGIDTLGRIVEVVSGMPYERFIADRIFTPLGMVDSSFFPDPAKAARIATVYTDENGTLKPTASRDTLYPSPGAGMLSTAADMARFYQMMLNKGTLNGHRLLSTATVDLMTAVHTGDMQAGFAPGMGFGLGWGVVRESKGAFRLCSVGSYGHGGAYRTYGWVDPPKDLIRVIMLQRTNGGGDVADEINAFLAMAAAAIER